MGLFLLAAGASTVAGADSNHLKGARPKKPEGRTINERRGDPRGRLTKEEIVENHERRRDHLVRHLQQTKDKVADHDSGTAPLEVEDYEKHSRRIPLYERKLERLKKPLTERD